MEEVEEDLEDMEVVAMEDVMTARQEEEITVQDDTMIVRQEEEDHLHLIVDEEVLHQKEEMIAEVEVLLKSEVLAVVQVRKTEKELLLDRDPLLLH